jgi:small subunit ribosomal protein S16
VGGKKDPVWRVVVADQRSPRDGRVIETIGHYNPQTQPSTIVIDEDRARAWIERGAQPTNVVRKLLRIRESAPAGAADGAEAQVGPTPASEQSEQPPEVDAQAGSSEATAATEGADSQAADAEGGADEAGGAEG